MPPAETQLAYPSAGPPKVLLPLEGRQKEVLLGRPKELKESSLYVIFFAMIVYHETALNEVSKIYVKSA